MDTKELWKSVPNTAGRYEVSNMGRVRSLFYRNRMTDIPRKEPHIMRPSLNGVGYLVHSHIVFDDGSAHSMLVHRMVLMAFVGPPPAGREGGHLNGDRTDNRLENLAWITHVENMAHKKLHGTQHFRPTREENGVTLYQCRKCDAWKPREGFHKLTAKLKSACGIESECKACRGMYMREYMRWRYWQKRGLPIPPRPEASEPSATPNDEPAAMQPREPERAALAPCTTPNGRMDGHMGYVEWKDGRLVCAFCGRDNSKLPDGQKEAIAKPIKPKEPKKRAVKPDPLPLPGEPVYRCTKCATMKPKSAYYPLKTTATGLNSWCKKCMNKRRSERRREEAQRLIEQAANN